MIRYSTLHRYRPLKAKKDLRTSYVEKIKSGLKQPYRYKPKPVNRSKYYSIFTNDLHHCFITGDADGVHVHHIFGGAKKHLSEKYGFLLPLRYDWHNGTSYSIHQDLSLALQYKIQCQEYYLKHYGTKEQFISEFQKWWIEKDSA